MNTHARVLPILVLVSATLLSGERAWAMPMFARKYKVDCSMCHAAVPRLNYTGFKFKAAGYRMPWEVGKAQADDALHLENYTAFVSFVNATVGLESSVPPSQSAQVNLQELDVHPMTGSWGANWSSGFEVDLLADGTVSVNQAFAGFTSGSSDSFWTAQAGILPNFLGFGPLDRPMAVSVPLVLSGSAGNSIQNTLFNWANPRAAGVTASTWLGDTFLSASVRNRLSDTPGGLDALGVPSTNRMGDVLLSATQFFDHKGAGSAVSLAYYHGQTQLPLPDGSGGFYANNYNHVVGAANYYLTDHWNLFAGAGWGNDQTENLNTGTVDMPLYDAGGFAGLEYFWSAQMAAGGRFDQFTSDLNTAGSGSTAATFYYHLRPINQVTLSAEYQYQQNGAASTFSPGVNQSVLTIQALLAF